MKKFKRLMTIKVFKFICKIFGHKMITSLSITIMPGWPLQVVNRKYCKRCKITLDMLKTALLNTRDVENQTCCLVPDKTKEKEGT